MASCRTAGLQARSYSDRGRLARLMIMSGRDARGPNQDHEAGLEARGPARQ
jgi:hypothetical protein